MFRDRRGTAAWEFVLVAVPFFTLIFGIIDFGRYAITIQSLSTLADAGARKMMLNCYTPNAIALPPQPVTGCIGDPMSAPDKQATAPFLYAGGLTPTLNVTLTTTGGSNTLTATASSPSFKMLLLFWGTSFDSPQASTSVPY